MKLSPSFVLALAAASGAVASPVVRRQAGSSGAASNSGSSLPTPSAVAPGASSAVSSASAVMSRASSTFIPSGTSSMPSPTGGAAPGGAGGAGAGNSSNTFNDTQILQYALTLEHLEATFYNQSLSKLSASDFENAGYNASVRNQIYSIGRDEAQHVEFLSTALGNDSIPACEYDFSSVTDVESFLTTARVLEGVGVSAYLGAAQNISNPAYLEAAGSILVVEGQHQTYMIAQTDDGGNAIPNAFATPLDFKEVYSLAAPFIKSCPSNASLPITAFPKLTLDGNGTYTPGQQVTVSYESSNSTNSSSSQGGNTYLAIIQGVTGPQFISLDSSNSSSSQVTLPSNLTGGQMYAVVTSSNSGVTDDNTIAGPTVGYVSIPLPEAPDATNTASSSSASGSASSTGSAAAGAGPTPTDSASSASSTATASGSDSIVSTDSAAAGPTGSMSGPAGPSGTSSASGSQGIAPSLASLGSAALPTPSGN